MKKIIPILSFIGLSTLLTGCGGTMANTKNEAFMNDFKAFQKHVEDYTNINDIPNTKIALNKYKLSFSAPIDATAVDSENLLIEENETINNNDNELLTNENQEETDTDQNLTEIEDNNSSIENYNENSTEDVDEENNLITDKQQEEIEQISTLYSLSDDIDDSCDEFCELKENLTDAIIETQNLIAKVQSSEIELTSEQRMFISEQARQLKDLGRQLSLVTSELSFNLSDLNQLLRDSNGDLDTLSMKYFVVLDNLVNGNEMLANGLNSLNLINQMFNMNSNLPGNNQGRILYGFRRNNEPPIVKDYVIDENGVISENEQTDTTENVENKPNNEETTNIDTFNQPFLKSNIDTYGNRRNNIDTFFNTAWLDNDFMYGNGGYNGYNMHGMGMQNGYYPYFNQNQNNNHNNTTNSVEKTNNTQNIDNNTEPKKKKKFQLKKNIDTYKDENTPTVSAKITNIKNNIAGFFNKFSKPDEENIQNPIYKYEIKE